MDEKLRHLIKEMPERPPRSKLEAHADVIRELRRKRRTYQEIAAFFREHLQVSVAPSTIHDFVKTRARRARQALTTPELPISLPPAISDGGDQRVRTAVTSSSSSELLDRIRAVKKQNVRPAMEPKRFEFDPQAPLNLKPKQEK